LTGGLIVLPKFKEKISTEFCKSENSQDTHLQACHKILFEFFVAFFGFYVSPFIYYFLSFFGQILLFLHAEDLTSLEDKTALQG